MKTSPCSASSTTARNTGLGSAIIRAGARSKTCGRLSDALLRCCADASSGQWRTRMHTTATSKMPTVTRQNLAGMTILSPLSPNDHTCLGQGQVKTNENGRPKAEPAVGWFVFGWCCCRAPKLRSLGSDLGQAGGFIQCELQPCL